MQTLSVQKKHTKRNLRFKRNQWLSARGISKQLRKEQIRRDFNTFMTREIRWMPLRGVRADLRSTLPQGSVPKAKRGIFARLFRRPGA